LGLVELVSFFGAAAGAVGRFLLGRWPEPPPRDYPAPGRRDRAPGISPRKPTAPT